MSGGDIVRLPTLDPATRATLHRPTGLRIVSIGVNCVSGSREELLRLAAEIIAADWEAGGRVEAPARAGMNCHTGPGR